VELASALSVATILADASVTPTVSEMTYNVSSGTLNHTQPTQISTAFSAYNAIECYDVSVIQAPSTNVMTYLPWELGFLTGPISLCLDSSEFMFVFLCLSCMSYCICLLRIIVIRWGWTWWD